MENYVMLDYSFGEGVFLLYTVENILNRNSLSKYFEK